MISYTKNSWALLSVLLSLIVIIPILSVIFFFIVPGDDTWIHLRETVLISYIFNSIILVIFVSIGTILIGVISAWLVTMYIFPLKKSNLQKKNHQKPSLVKSRTKNCSYN